MTTKDQALSKVKALVPELMELSFGCRVEFENDTYRITRHQTYKGETEPRYHAEHPVKIGLTIKHSELENVEVLGHPIQLHHILLAVERSGNGELRVLSKGRVFWHDGLVYAASGVGSTRIGASYDLTKDAEHQSEEFYQLLNEIL